MNDRSQRIKAILVLLLLVPVPSIGTGCALILLKGQPVGQTIFTVAKFWILLLPLLWLLLVDRGRISWSRPAHGGFVTSIIWGVAIAAVIFAAYWLIGRLLINQQDMRKIAVEVGLDDRTKYLLLCVYWICVNSLLEEYVWRWFVFDKCRVLMPSIAAVFASALFFTLHHIVALGAYFDWRVTVLASLGVFIGGAVWSGLYLKYRSIWPPFVSHAIADVPVFVIGYLLIFGA